MTAEGAEEVIRLVAGIAVYPWPSDGSKQRAWMLTLASPHTADIDDTVAITTTIKLMGEYGPDKLTAAQILTSCRCSPVRPQGHSVVPNGSGYRLQSEAERLMLEAPEEPMQRRKRLNQEDRAALARLAQAFHKAHEMPAFDHFVATLGTCGLDWGAEFAEEDAVEEVPF